MDSLFDVFKRHEVSFKKNKGRPVRKRNINYEQAEEFGAYCGLNTIFVLKLFKIYGKEKVLGLRSWLADYPAINRKKMAGLVIWKLKEDGKLNSKTVGGSIAGNVSQG